MQRENVTTVKHRKKAKCRNRSNLGADFVAPDGGWAWIVCLASGFSTFCAFAPIQQYGIIYRQRMHDLGFNAKQITSIINAELAAAAVTGIINGALFRRFSYRQAALGGAVLLFLGTLLTAYCEAFWQYLFCFACLYGVGLGMNLSAMALAVNTYFKERRRRATGFSSSITGLGPIILPHLCTLLLQFYGTKGTILLIAALTLNTVAMALTLQPVTWHVKPKNSRINKVEAVPNESSADKVCPQCQKSSWNIFGNQHLLTDVEDSSKSDDDDDYNDELGMFRNATLASFGEDWLSSMESIKTEMKPSVSKIDAFKLNGTSREILPTNFCTCDNRSQAKSIEIEESSINVKQSNLLDRIIKFFDLDLLTDITFINLVQGMTIMMFCELNFSFLTPFILGSYGYNNEEISLAMSLLAGVDIVVRFGAPLVLEKVKLGNNVLFAFGIIILALGRLLVTLAKSFHVMLGIFMLMGFGKGFRTIFAPLILPSYVPLNRLAAASGLQLFLNAIFTTAFGPLLGLIADLSSYTFTIHFMNLLTFTSLSFWFLEWLVRRVLKQSHKNDDIN